MTLDELIALRKAAKLTQAEMATLLDMKLRGYHNIEVGETPLTNRHVWLAERGLLRLAVERGDINLAPPSVRRDALALARLITGE